MQVLNDYHVEFLNQNSGFFIQIKKLLYETQTDYQNLKIVDSFLFGKVLILDNIYQTSELDEFLYHEPLVHVPHVMMNGEAKKALVIGGGDGGAIEEILKYPNIEKVVMIELDELVVKKSIEYLPSISNHAFNSPKLFLEFKDGIEYLKQTTEKFDHILLDLTDAFGPSLSLYTKEFYDLVADTLTARGILSLHIESPIALPSIFKALYHTLQTSFKYVQPMLNFVPMYGSLWGFAIASNHASLKNITAQQIEQCLQVNQIKDLKFYNAQTHFNLVQIPPYVDAILKEGTKSIITEDNKDGFNFISPRQCKLCVV